MKQSYLIPIIFSLIIFQLFLFENFAFAETSKITIVASEGSVIDEDLSDENFGGFSLITSGWTNSLKEERVFQAQSYLKFDLGDKQKEIPKSNYLETVVIDSVEFKVLIQTAWESADRYIVTVNHCPDNSWSENTIVWNNRACQNESELHGLDSALVDPKELPALYSWDVTKSVREAIEDNRDITFVITTRAITNSNELEGELQDSALFPPGLVWMWSDDRQQFGLSTAPRITITYSVLPSQLSEDLEFLVVFIIPILAIIVPFMVWIYRKTKNTIKPNSPI